MVHKETLRLSDLYFTHVLTGKIDPGSQDFRSFNPDADYEVTMNMDGEGIWRGLPPTVEADDPKPFIFPEEEEREAPEWIATEFKDYHHLSRYELNEKLFEAAQKGKVMAIKALVSSGARVNCRGKVAKGWTPLFSAAYNGHLQVMERLCQLGANVTALSAHRSTPLHATVAGSGNPACVRILLEYGADLEARSDEGYTAIHTAAAFARMKALTILVQYGGNISRVSDSGLNATQIARLHDFNRTAEAIEHLADQVTRGELGMLKLQRRRASSPQPEDEQADVSIEADQGDVDASAEELWHNAPKIKLVSSSDSIDLSQESFI
mmetsp:Transcript_29976/g.46993  ORF Transcript_29976/g.46993 Transcript_29976/m.46993 type:complete len:323 (+) Transcript_29976:32-1000(+)